MIIFKNRLQAFEILNFPAMKMVVFFPILRSIGRK